MRHENIRKKNLYHIIYHRRIIDHIIYQQTILCMWKYVKKNIIACKSYRQSYHRYTTTKAFACIKRDLNYTKYIVISFY